MLGSLLHFETKKQREDKQRAQRKDQERKKRRREATSTKKDDGRNQNHPSANATMQLNRTWQGGATSASSSSSSFRDRSRSFDTFDAAGRKRSISNQDLNAAVHALASSRTTLTFLAVFQVSPPFMRSVSFTRGQQTIMQPATITFDLGTWY